MVGVYMVLLMIIVVSFVTFICIPKKFAYSNIMFYAFALLLVCFRIIEYIAFANVNENNKDEEDAPVGYSCHLIAQTCQDIIALSQGVAILEFYI